MTRVLATTTRSETGLMPVGGYTDVQGKSRGDCGPCAQSTRSAGGGAGFLKGIG